MEIFPRDLGTSKRLAVLARRMTPGVSDGTGGRPITYTDAAFSADDVKPRRGRIMRWLTRGLDMDETTAEKAAALAWDGPTGVSSRVGFWVLLAVLFLPLNLIFWAIAFSGGPWFLPIFSTLITLATGWGLHYNVRSVLQKAEERALSAAEVESLLLVARGRLDEAYLNLVRDALRSDVPSLSAQSDLRSALRALGETIARLPAERTAVTDQLELARNARTLREQAAKESDTVVRDSLLRQAATLERRVGAAGESVKAARRVQALRREARVQMDALRSVLVGFDTGLTEHAGAASLSSATELAEAVQRAAREAEAAAVARQELENEELNALLHHAAVTLGTSGAQTAATAAATTPAAAPAPPPPPRPTTVQQPEEQQQVVVQSNRPWWRSGT